MAAVHKLSLADLSAPKQINGSPQSTVELQARAAAAPEIIIADLDKALEDEAIAEHPAMIAWVERVCNEIYTSTGEVPDGCEIMRIWKPISDAELNSEKFEQELRFHKASAEKRMRFYTRQFHDVNLPVERRREALSEWLECLKVYLNMASCPSSIPQALIAMLQDHNRGHIDPLWKPDPVGNNPGSTVQQRCFICGALGSAVLLRHLARKTQPEADAVVWNYIKPHAQVLFPRVRSKYAIRNWRQELRKKRALGDVDVWLRVSMGRFEVAMTEVPEFCQDALIAAGGSPAFLYAVRRSRRHELAVKAPKVLERIILAFAFGYDLVGAKPHYWACLRAQKPSVAFATDDDVF